MGGKLFGKLVEKAVDRFKARPLTLQKPRVWDIDTLYRREVWAPDTASLSSSSDSSVLTVVSWPGPGLLSTVRHSHDTHRVVAGNKHSPPDSGEMTS